MNNKGRALLLFILLAVIVAVSARIDINDPEVDETAGNICTGDTTYLSGESNCNDLDLRYLMNESPATLESLNVSNNLTLGESTDLYSYGITADGCHGWTNSSGDLTMQLCDDGNFTVTGPIDITAGDYYVLTCGENQVLDPAQAEWSCGGNGEIGQYVPIFQNSTIKHIGLYCNTVIGEANITIQKYSGIDTACDLNGTAPHTATCDVDLDEGEWIRPYTVHDTGHAACVLTMGLETR